MTNTDPDFDFDPDVGHLSDMNPDAEVITKSASGEWITTTVRRVLEAEASGEDLE